MAYMCMCFKFHWYDIICMLFFTVLCLWFNLFSLAMYNSGLQCNRLDSLVHYCLLESMPKMKHWCQFLIIWTKFMMPMYSQLSSIYLLWINIMTQPNFTTCTSVQLWVADTFLPPIFFFHHLQSTTLASYEIECVRSIVDIYVLAEAPT